MNGTYEIEIKSLLGDRANAEALEARMLAHDPALQKIGTHRQLNHYFEGHGDLAAVAEVLKDSPEKKVEFLDLAGKAKDYSLRTRDADGQILLVLKASIDDTTSSNGTARREFESAVHLSLADLDAALLAAGFRYQAKWSRERTEFELAGVNVTIDKNAGYGYLAEFEIIESDPAKAGVTKAKLRKLMADLGVEELPQDRLARMFDFYNKNWADYYGTEKIFVIQ